MAETNNIATMAEVLSEEIFGVLGWKRKGPTNQNWDCVKTDEHEKKTHPSDVVFAYKDVYTNDDIYFNFDLKSYAGKSITSGAIRPALASLSQQVTCANVSNEWEDLYVDDADTHKVYGVLFIYNHDGEYDKNFKSALATVKDTSLTHPRGTKLFVIGPADIFWINNVCAEIQRLRGASKKEDRIPMEEDCEFHYPHLARRTNLRKGSRSPATIETILGDALTLKYEKKTTGITFYKVFYRGGGIGSDEFIYLLYEFLFYQMLDEDSEIEIITIGSSDKAPVMLGKAKTAILSNLAESTTAMDSNNAENSSLFDLVTIRACKNVQREFSEIEIGMATNGR